MVLHNLLKAIRTYNRHYFYQSYSLDFYKKVYAVSLVFISHVVKRGAAASASAGQQQAICVAPFCECGREFSEIGAPPDAGGCGE